jgi:hypothetical protein
LSDLGNPILFASRVEDVATPEIPTSTKDQCAHCEKDVWLTPSSTLLKKKLENTLKILCLKCWDSEAGKYWVMAR